MTSGKRIQDNSFAALASVSLLIAFAGFWFTYWRPLFAGVSFRLLLHVHAGLWFGWFLLLVAQSVLIRTGNKALHQRVGLAGIVYSTATIVISLALAVQTIGRDAHLINGSFDAVPTIIPLTQILMFAAFFALAAINRQRPDVHKRLILLAALVAVTPALARISIGLLGGPSVPLIFAASNALVLIAVFADWRGSGRLHPVYLWGGVAIVLVRILRVPLAMSPAWERAAAAIRVLAAA